MKKLLLLLTIVVVPLFTRAQNTAIDQLFEKYQGKEGITYVIVNKEMFEILSDAESCKGEMENPLENIDRVRVLAIEDKEENESVNFYEELKGNMDFSVYKELIVVKEKAQDVQILAKSQEGVISELLVIVGGEDNVLVLVEGNFTFNQLSALSEIDGLEHLDLLD